MIIMFTNSTTTTPTNDDDNNDGNKKMVNIKNMIEIQINIYNKYHYNIKDYSDNR